MSQKTKKYEEKLALLSPPHIREPLKLDTDFVHHDPGGNAACFKEDRRLTVDQAIEEVGMGWGTFLLILGPFLILTFEGVELLGISILGLILKCQWDLTSLQVILIQIASYIGWGIGSVLSAAPAEIYGRKPPMIVGMVGLLIFGVLNSFAVGLWSFFVLRIFVGFFVGIAVGPAQVYLCELSPIKYRARIMSLSQVSYGVGLLIAMFSSYLILGVFHLKWNFYMFITSIIFLPVIFVLYFAMDESPMFLVNNQGKLKEAQRIIQKLSAKNGEGVIPMTLVKRPECTKSTQKMTLHDICRYIAAQNHTKPILLFVVLMFSMAVCGMGFIFVAPRLISEPICKNMNTSIPAEEVHLVKCDRFDTQVLKEMTMTVLLQPFTPFIAALLADKIGRRLTITLTSILTFLVFTFLQFCLGKTVMLVNMFILQALGPMVLYISYLYCAEYFPTVIRSFVTGLLYSIGRFAIIIAVVTAQWVYDASPRATLVIFQAGAIGIFLPLLFLKKETTYLSLE